MLKNEKRERKKNLLLIKSVRGLLKKCVRPKSLPRTEKSGIPLSWVWIAHSSLKCLVLLMKYLWSALLWFSVSPKREKEREKKPEHCVYCHARNIKQTNSYDDYLMAIHEFSLVRYRIARFSIDSIESEREKCPCALERYQSNALFGAFLSKCYLHQRHHTETLTCRYGNAFPYAHTLCHQQQNRQPQLW